MVTPRIYIAVTMNGGSMGEQLVEMGGEMPDDLGGR